MLRPKNCKKCGGKMQMGGQMPRQQDFPDYESWAAAMDAWQGSQKQMVPSTDLQNLLQSYNVQESDVQYPPMEQTGQPAQVNPLQDAFNKDIIDARPPEGFDSPRQAHDYANTPAVQKKPSAIQNLQNVGIGLRGARTGLQWLSGAIERRRQNQYDYKQQTALGQMNPMQASDFQPNPFSLYAKYGGNLKTIISDFNKYSNNAQFDFGSGDNDNGKMQVGGALARGVKEVFHPRSPMYTGNPNDPRLKAYQDSLNLYKLDQVAMNAQDATEIAKFNYHLAHLNLNRGKYTGQVDNSYLNDPTVKSMQANVDNAYKKIDAYKPMSNVDNEPVFNGYNTLGFNVDWVNNVGGDVYPNLRQVQTSQYMKPVQPVVYKPEPKKIIPPVQDTLPVVDTTRKLRGFRDGGKMKKGGYEIDRMLIVRKILPELLKMGRLGSGKYRELGGEMKKGGNWIPKNMEKGRCTPAPNPDCPVGSPQYNLAQTFKKHHGFHGKKK